MEIGMKESQISLVQDSFKKVAPIAEAAAELFYGRLFEIAPQVKPMFAESDMKSQGQKLMMTLSVAVKGLSDLDSIVPIVQKLGVTHIKYGVKEEHFPIVADALLWTLEKGLGDDWNEELKGAWVEAYTILSGTMIDAMNAEMAKQKEQELVAEATEEQSSGFWGKVKGIFSPA